MEWLEHYEPDCTGEWRYSKSARCFYCIVCKEWHFLTDDARRAYARWRYVATFLNAIWASR